MRQLSKIILQNLGEYCYYKIWGNTVTTGVNIYENVSALLYILGLPECRKILEKLRWNFFFFFLLKRQGRHGSFICNKTVYLKQVTQNVKICMNSVFADRLSWSLGKAQSDLELVTLLPSGVAGITGHHPSLGVNFFAVCCWHLVGWLCPHPRGHHTAGICIVLSKVLGW